MHPIFTVPLFTRAKIWKQPNCQIDEWIKKVWCVCVCVSVCVCMYTQSLCCVQLCDPIDCSPPGSFDHGIFQARKLVWAAVSYSRTSSRPKNWTHISWGSCIQEDSLPLHHLGSPSTSSASSKNVHTYAHYTEMTWNPCIDSRCWELCTAFRRGRVPFTRRSSSLLNPDGTAPSLPSWFRTQGLQGGLSEPYTAHGGPSIHGLPCHKGNITHAAQAPNVERPGSRKQEHGQMERKETEQTCRVICSAL